MWRVGKPEPPGFHVQGGVGPGHLSVRKGTFFALRSWSEGGRGHRLGSWVKEGRG